MLSVKKTRLQTISQTRQAAQFGSIERTMVPTYQYECSPLNRVQGRKAVAIVGTSMDPRTAPLNDPTVDIWGMNRSHPWFKDAVGRFRADLWFDLHDMSAQEQEDMDWFAACPVPVLLPEADTRFPQTRSFPDIDVLLGITGGLDYFACSMSYMVALAMGMGYRHIHIHGCDCVVGRELLVERASLSYWAGYAQGKGHRVTIAGDPTWRLLHHPARYGFDYWTEKNAVHQFARDSVLEIARCADEASHVQHGDG